LNDAISGQGGLGMIYEQLIRQASMLSFNDAFYLTSIIMLCVLPLVFLMKRRRAAAPAGMH
jgi:DHA2 family multidrug resistance protein